MGTAPKATQTKRLRERNRQENHELKIEKRAIRKEQRKERELTKGSGLDPDLAGIVPGPQPIPPLYG